MSPTAQIVVIELYLVLYGAIIAELGGSWSDIRANAGWLLLFSFQTLLAMGWSVWLVAALQKIKANSTMEDPMMAHTPDEPDTQKMAEALGPGAIDRQLREAIAFCWMALPPKRKTIDEVEKEMRRLLDRAFRDMREDERLKQE